MTNRKPFNLQKILVSYNLIEVFINAYTTYWIISETIEYKYLRCLPRDHHSFSSAVEIISETIEYKYLRCLPRDHHSFSSAVERTMPLWKFIFFNKTLELLDT
ncbi:hypothetical protein AVEN_274723-2, partial [Araneus ventricosus]